MNKSEAVIYLPLDPDREERWEIVAASLRAAGFSNIQPAPMPAQNFKPRHARPVMPILISRAEV